MLDVINQYSHGYVVTPIILTFREKGIFHYFQKNTVFTVEKLTQQFNANTGYVLAALRIFESLGWVSQKRRRVYTQSISSCDKASATTSSAAYKLVCEQRVEPTTQSQLERRRVYRVNIDEDTYQHIEALPKKLISLYEIPINTTLLKNKRTGRQMVNWLKWLAKAEVEERPILGKGQVIDEFLQGVVLVPLLLALNAEYVAQGMKSHQSLDLQGLSDPLQHAISDLFVRKGWAENNDMSIKSDGAITTLTPAGQFMLERALNMATVASYAPMLRKFSELLLGDPKKVFKRSDSHHEQHVDRSLNVMGSGFQHERYFEDIDNIILTIFNTREFEKQPSYIVDMGCGDGSLLRRVYKVIQQQSLRGSVLTEHPVTMVGVDYNLKSLEATHNTLKGIPHYTLQGDINDPHTMLDNLKTLGIQDFDKVLHLRSFLDHDRPFLPPADKERVEERARIPYQGIYIDENGQSISPPVVIQSVVEHLKRWASVVNRHGIIILEVHPLTPQIILAYRDHNESLHFDAYHAFSKQFLIEAEVFLFCAAEAGLFPKYEVSKRYPTVFPYSRITLNYFEKRPYVLEYALTMDIPALLELESKGWTSSLVNSKDIIAKRIDVFPEGQMVVKQCGKIVASVYTQCIANVDELLHTPYAKVDALHTPHGNTIQLLGINIDPEMQNRGLGDELLKFILQWARLKAGIEKVVGVTRAANYKEDASLTLNEYIQNHISSDSGIDPILRFHTSHGAKVIGVLPGYRPEDIDNKGAGILIEYDILKQAHRLTLNESLQPVQTAIPEAVSTTMPSNRANNALIIDEVVHGCIRDILAQKNIQDFSETAPLLEVGLDSLGLLELRTLINQRFNLSVDSTFFFQYNTAKNISKYLQEQIKLPIDVEKSQAMTSKTQMPPMLSCNVSPTMKVETPIQSPTQRSIPKTIQEPIAIIGMACRFPGGIKNSEAYWEVLETGKDTIGRVPGSRWDSEEYAEFPINFGGFLDNVDKFDADFFNIAPREAELMDPQQRFLLEVSYEALEEAGIPSWDVRGTKTGVFVGIFSHDYESLLTKHIDIKALDPYFGSGNSASVAAGRISYVLGLEGPAMSVNTACSSSLVAVHLACQSLRQNECHLALAGGVNLLLSPALSVAFSKAGMLSPDGRCKTFDSHANGYGRSEGCAVLVLKKLSQAVKEGDTVHAILRNSVVNQDGASNGLTAPNKTAQVNLLRSALEGENISSNRISYIETHGTGTPLGDPIEVKAISEVYGHGRQDNNPLMLGSVKQNIGHTEAAAGIAGLIKVVLALKYKRIPANIHFSQLNPHIELMASNIIIPTQTLPWTTLDEKPRMAGVSSFGFSGTNVHIVVEESDHNTLLEMPSKPYYLLTVSSKKLPTLKQQLENLNTFLMQHPDVSIESLAYTLNTGRNHFEFRYACVASSIPTLQRHIKTQLDNGVFFNSVDVHMNKKVEPTLREWLETLLPEKMATLEDKEKVDSIVEQVFQQVPNFKEHSSEHYREQLTILAVLYEKGYEIQWKRLHQGEAHQRLSLPTYPFLDTRYWVPKADCAIPKDISTVSTTRLPPLQANTNETLPHFYVPRWKLAPNPKCLAITPTLKSMWCIDMTGDPCAHLIEAIKQNAKSEQCVHIVLRETTVFVKKDLWTISADDSSAWEQCFKQAVEFPELIMVMMSKALPGRCDDTVNTALPENYESTLEKEVLVLFRLFKYLNNSENENSLEIKIITQHQEGRVGTPHASAAIGLSLSAVKEQSQWTLNCIDIPSAEDMTAQELDSTIQAIFKEPTSNTGEVLRIQGNFRARQTLVPLRMERMEGTSFLTGGVYIIAGGTSGIGYALSQYLAKHYQATLIWLGRRDLHLVTDKIQDIRSLGGEALYFQVDIANKGQLSLVYRKIKDKNIKINGVFDSAFVLNDALLINMTDAMLKEVLAPKWVGSINLYTMVEQESLDFFVFFSSIQSFIGSPGQSNYTAASTFQDAYALSLQETAYFPVKVINWGYWGSVGRVANEYYQQRMKSRGIVTIVPEVGMQAIETILQHPAAQIAYIHLDPENALESIIVRENTVESIKQGISLQIPSLDVNLPPPSEEDAKKKQCFDNLCVYALQTLFFVLQREGVFQTTHDHYSLEILLQRLAIIANYQPLFIEWLELLCAHGFLENNKEGYTCTALALSPPDNRSEPPQHPRLEPHTTLLLHCVTHGLAVLQGKKNAPEVLFPEGSFTAVQAFYQDEEFTKFNKKTATLINAFVQGYLTQDPLATVRILEIGAGTGSTSVLVLEALSAFKDNVTYCFSDISKKFIHTAEEKFAKSYPFVCYKTLDIENNPLDQGFEPGHFDLILAANVLHATRIISKTLDHTKILLKRGGQLLLNEVMEKNPFLTLTFGLTPGWWLAQDEYRTSGSPVLNKQAWRALLTLHGWEKIKISQVSGNLIATHLVLAESNGIVVRLTEEKRSDRKAEITLESTTPSRSELDPPSLQASKLELRDKKENRLTVGNEKNKNPATHSVDNPELKQHLKNDLISIISGILKLPIEAVDSKEEFTHYGFDSITFVELANGIKKILKLSVTPALFFEYSTLEKFMSYVLETHASVLIDKYGSLIAVPHAEMNTVPTGVQTESDPPLEQTEHTSTHRFIQKNTDVPSTLSNTAPSSTAVKSSDIAIIGVAGSFPGSEEDLEIFWKNICEQKDLISEIPKERFDYSQYAIPKWGGFLKDIDKFDAAFFNISPREAEFMDPQQRLFLQTVWHAVEDAGYAAESLSHQKVGLFAGVSTSDYANLINEHEAFDTYTATGTAHSILANRVSYLLNFSGPSEVVDTACSSSLVAIHHAVKSLQQGECNVAIAGGANALLSPVSFITFNQTGMLALDGRCKTFDKEANGYVRGEGAGAVVLKPLVRALDDNDHIYAIIKGVAVNHGGHVNTLTAPNPNAHAALIVDAFKTANIHPKSVTYIETHGTGTRLGDPIEINGLKKAFQRLDPETTDHASLQVESCGLGALKANIGHLEAAAGIAGLIKLVLMLKYRKIPGQVHFKALNPYLDLKGSPFYVVTKTQEWNSEMPRRACISSFGFGGTNAHVILEEGINNSAKAVSNKPYYLLSLSAKNKDSLQQRVQDLQKFLMQHYTISPTAVSIEDVAYTLNVGRNHFKHRCAFVVASTQELLKKLEKLQDPLLCTSSLDDFFTGVVAKDPADKALYDEVLMGIIEKLQEVHQPQSEYKKRLLTLANLYVKGYDLPWQFLHHNESKRRISLPTYPFQKERYWIQEKNKHSPLTQHKPKLLSQTPGLHPMLGFDASTLDTCCFKTLLSKQLFYLADHDIQGQTILPGVAYLEMARAAATFAVPQRKIQEVKEVYWLRPLIVADSVREVTVSLFQEGEELRFEVSTDDSSASNANQDNNNNTIKIHAQGKMDYGSFISEAVPWNLLATVERQLPHHYEGPVFYEQFRALNYNYGPSFQAIHWVKTDGYEILSAYCLPESVKEGEACFELHPSILDAALQTTMVNVLFGPTPMHNALFLPYALGSLRVFRSLPRQGYTFVRNNPHTHSDTLIFDLQLWNEAGEVCAELKYFQVRRVDQPSFALQTASSHFNINPLSNIEGADVNEKREADKTMASILTPEPSVDLSKALKSALRTMISEVLKLKEGVLEDDEELSSYGFDSLSFTELSARLKQQYTITMMPALFFDYPTINQLVNYLKEKYEDELLQHHSTTLPPMNMESKIIVSEDPELCEVLPLSIGQQQLYTTYLCDPTSCQYNVGFALELLGEIDKDLLQKAIQCIVKRHDVFRMSFEVEEGIPRARLHSTQEDIPLNTFETTCSHGSDITQTIQALNSKPWDLASSALIRCYLLPKNNQHHVLVILMPHIITDGWSFYLINKELMQHYNALLENPAYQAMPLRSGSRYRDFIVWQQKVLTPPGEQNLLRFWKRILKTPPLPLRLSNHRSLDKKSKDLGKGQVSGGHFLISSSMTHALKACASKYKTNLFVCLLSAYQLMLARYSHQAELVIGVPFFGREETEFQETLGYFINTLPIPCTVLDPMNFSQLLEQNQQLIREAKQYQALSLPRLLSELKLSREETQHPLFQVMFNFVNMTLPKPKFLGVQGSYLWYEGGRTEYELAMDLVEEHDQVTCFFNYNGNIFTEEYIQSLSKQYCNLLNSIVSDPEQSVWTLDLMDEALKKTIIEEWNQTDINDFQDKTIVQLFETQVNQTPDAIALVLNDQVMTYQTLNERADHLASYLIAHGIQPECKIAICLERSFEMIIAVLGVWKAGAAYVPLDPHYPPARLDFILKDSEASLLITNATWKGQFHEYKDILLELSVETEVLRVHTQQEERARNKGLHAPNTQHALKTQHAAYLIYTSGSTGNPKGVIIEHKGLPNLAYAQSELFHIHSTSRVLQLSSFSFDASVSEMITAFSQGATLCLLHSKEELAGESLVKRMKEMKVTVATLSPSVLASFPEEADLPSLDTLVLAGEITPPYLIERWQKKVRLLNAYGPTEATVCASVACFGDKGDIEDTGDHNPQTAANVIGKPISNVKLYILDPHQQPVPIGVEGELYIGGVGVARGYHHQPLLTQERFIPNPFIRSSSDLNASNGLMYRSGDRARYRSDGNIEYLGRIDNQVKLRGLRIELTEIEHVLQQHTQVRDALVVLREDEPHTKSLVAYVILKENLIKTSSEHEISELIRQWREVLSTVLPEYMVPACYVIVDHFPLTPNNKIDRNALPPPNTLYRGVQAERVAPRDKIEHNMVMLWSKVLGLSAEHIGIEDNFFHLGGNSLLILRLLYEMKKTFNISVTLPEILQNPTIAGLRKNDHHLSKMNKGDSTAKKILSVLPIKTEGTPIVFLVHPIGGLGFVYLPLVNYLNCALYGLQNPYFGQECYFKNIDELLDSYIAAMKSIQPMGPYRLGGWSLGGNIALLMAQKLKAEGEPIAQLILIDSYKHSSFTQVTQVEAESIMQRYLKLSDSADTFDTSNDQEMIHWQASMKREINRGIKWMFDDYPLYNDSVDLIKAETLDRESLMLQDPSLQALAQDPYNGWKSIVRELRIHVVPGSHYELFSPKYLASTAECLHKVLNEDPNREENKAENKSRDILNANDF